MYRQLVTLYAYTCTHTYIFCFSIIWPRITSLQMAETYTTAPKEVQKAEM